MTLQGTLKDGTIVLDQPVPFPEGTRVELVVTPMAPECERPQRTTKELLMEFAGCMTDLPSDLARHHDHYLHGTPKS